MKYSINNLFKKSNFIKKNTNKERIKFAEHLTKLYKERNPNKSIDFGDIDYDNVAIPIEERKLVINGIESNLYMSGISDPIYNMELKAYIYKIHDYLRYQPDNFSNLLLKANVYMVLSDGIKLNKTLNQLISNFKSSLSSMMYTSKDKEKFFHILRISVSTFVLLKHSSAHFMETKGYLIDIKEFYSYFNLIEKYYQRICTNISTKEKDHIKNWLVIIFSNYSWYTSYYGDIERLNSFLERIYYLFEEKETEILCTLSTRSFYKKTCTYSRLAFQELKKNKKELQKNIKLVTFYNSLKLTNVLLLDNTSLYKYYIKYKEILLKDIKRPTHLDILRLLIENPKYFKDILDEAKELSLDTTETRENRLKTNFLLINIYLKTGLYNDVYRIFKESYSKFGCKNFMEASQYINVMDALSILVKERTLFEYLYYTFIFKPLYRGKITATNVNLFVKLQSKISKIYNFVIINNLYQEYMKQNISFKNIKNIILINPYTDMNNFYSPIHVYYNVVKQGIPIINLTENEINFFDNTLHRNKEKPIMLSYSNDCVVGIEKHWKEDFNNWEISFEKKKIICNGINYYQTFFETVARAQKKFTIDWNSIISQYYFLLFKRRMDRNIYAYGELKKVLPEDISIKFIASMYHYSPWSYYSTSFLHKNNPSKESLIQINAAYENYKADEINEKFASITALNLTLNQKSRAVAFGSSEHFTHWVKDRIDGYELKHKIQKQIQDVHVGQELKLRLEKAQNEGKKIICIIGKLLYDLCVPYMGGTFKDMREWAVATNNFVLDRDDIFLLVKPHPHEIVYEVSNVASESFLDWFSDDKEKVYKIGHKEIGLSELTPYVDIFTLWNGTSVIELAKDRRNIVVCDDWAQNDYPIGLKQPQTKKSYFKALLKAKKWDPNALKAIERAKMAELYEEHLSSREFTVENIGVIRSSTNTNWNVPYLKPDKVIEEFRNPSQDWDKILKKILDV